MESYLMKKGKISRKGAWEIQGEAGALYLSNVSSKDIIDTLEKDCDSASVCLTTTLTSCPQKYFMLLVVRCTCLLWVFIATLALSAQFQVQYHEPFPEWSMPTIAPPSWDDC